MDALLSLSVGEADVAKPQAAAIGGTLLIPLF
jgi:hypothetical protein